LVNRFLSLLKHRRDISAWFDNDGVDALGGEFVAVSFRKRFQSKLAGAVPAWLKRQAYAEYGVTQYKTGDY
jgi:hypothetical protein